MSAGRSPAFGSARLPLVVPGLGGGRDGLFSVNYFGRFASIVLAGSDHVDRYQQH